MADIRASVLIPVKNGGALLGDVLGAVLAQQTPWPFEVIVVDSGSSDGSVELARRFGVRVETIAPAEFAHGRTRNLLASMAAGQFLVFITQDARPASPQWLVNLVQGCDAEPGVAGAFGPHRAHPHARHVTHCELNQHFAGFGDQLSVVRLEDRARFAADPGYRQWLHFFSSNNACIRRAVAFVPDAVVYHSHDFGVWETLQRNFDEARSFNLYFGYRIQDSLPRALRSAVHLARRDLAWLRSGGLRGWRLFKNAGYMAFIELARVAGQYLGTRHDRLPPWLLRSVSRDEQLQRAGVA